MAIASEGTRRALGTMAAIAAVIALLMIVPPRLSRRFSPDNPSPGRRTVTGPAIRGSLIDSIGRTVADARIALYSSERRIPDEVILTDSGGRFWFVGLDDKLSYTLAIDATGFRGERIHLDAPRGVGQVTLRPDNSDSARAAIHGVVLGPDNRPVPGARVLRIPTDHPRSFLTATTAADGSFVFDRAASLMEEWVVIDAPGFALCGQRLRSREPIRVRLAPAATLKLRVVDERGAPVAGHLLRLARISNPQVDFPSGRLEIEDALTRTDPSGMAIFTRVPPASTVTIGHYGRTDYGDTFNIPETGGTVNGNIQLRDGDLIQGVVRDPDGRPLPDTIVQLESRDALRFIRTRTDSSGHFTVGELPATLFIVSTDAAPRPLVSVSRVRTQPGATPVELNLVAASIVRGQVRGRVSGRAVTEAFVLLRNNGNNGGILLPIQDDGAFSARVIPGDGSIALMLAPAGNLLGPRPAPVDEQVTIHSGAVLTRTFLVDGPYDAQAELNLRRPDGSPAAGARVRYLRGAELRETRADGTGRIVIANPPLERERYVRFFIEDGSFWAQISLSMGANAHRDVTLSPGALPQIRGQALDTGGHPVANAKVTAFLEEIPGPDHLAVAAGPGGARGVFTRENRLRAIQSVVTDASGRFALLTWTGARFQIEASIQSRRALVPQIPGMTQTVALDRPLTLRLPRPGGAIRGRVKDAKGIPVPDIAVQIRGERTETNLRTDASGSFFADGVAAGDTLIVGVSRGPGEKTPPVSVAAGTRTIQINLPAPRPPVRPLPVYRGPNQGGPAIPAGLHPETKGQQGGK